MRASLSDIQQGKQENPDDVDEVPVEPDALNARQILVLGDVHCKDQHDDQAGENVQSVQTCNCVIERPEATGGEDKAFTNFVRPLEALHCEEDESAERGKSQELRGFGAVVGVRSLVREHGK